VLVKSDFDITEAIRFFNTHSVEATYLVPTEVGLGKSIMDATSPLRSYLKEKQIHDYEGQTQGPEGKRTVETFFVTETNLIPTTASLYRPQAKGKEGDPRIWFSKLPSYASPNNLLGIVGFDKALYVINLSNPNVIQSANDQGSPLYRLFKQINTDQSSVSDELLDKLREVASRGWIKTVTAGDTGVGATLEHCLGIQTNSSRKPDYKGIELKTKRTTRLRDKTRSNLFAQVANWDISTLKSSAQILDTYGYFRNSAQRLNCSVSSLSPNSQGLMLKIDEQADLLHEIHLSNGKPQDVVSWKFEVLRDRLLTKHNETFWIGANSSVINGDEHFQYKKVLYTRNPFSSIFHTLCDQGVVTVDHLIKREDGAVKEKGPLFKIKPSNLGLLFPPPLEFDLTSK
jgi:hypothetical protein